MTKRTVSTFGHYFSIGIGPTINYGIKGAGGLISYSLSYKSHLASITYGAAMGNGVSSGDPIFNVSYFGFLIGESVRFKNLMLSLSTGVASSDIWIYYNTVYNPKLGWYTGTTSSQSGISVPIELKLFLLARNGIGIGIHISESIVSPAKYSPFYFGLSVVGGRWNKAKAKK